MVPSNVRKKINEPPNVTKVQSRDIDTAQCENGTIECEKKLNVKKV